MSHCGYCGKSDPTIPAGKPFIDGVLLCEVCADRMAQFPHDCASCGALGYPVRPVTYADNNTYSVCPRCYDMAHEKNFVVYMAGGDVLNEHTSYFDAIDFVIAAKNDPDYMPYFPLLIQEESAVGGEKVLLSVLGL